MFDAGLFVLGYGLGLVLLLLVRKRLGIRFDVVSLPGVFLLSFLAFAYVGLVFLYFRLDPLSVSIGATNPALVWAMLGCTVLSLAGVLAGFAAMQRLRALPQPPAGQAAQAFSRSTLLLVVGLLLVCCLAAGAAILESPRVALFEALRGNKAAIVLARSQMTNARAPGAFDWQRLLYIDMFQFLLFCLFAHALARRKIASLVLFLAFLGLGLAASYLAMQKHDAVFLLAGLALTSLLARRGGRVPALFVAAAVPVLATVLLVPYVLSYSWPLYELIKNVGQRLCIGSLSPAYFYLKLFPDAHPFLHGKSLSNLLGLLPFEQFPLTRFVYDNIYPEHAGTAIVGSAPTVFWGEAYANFGWAGPLAIGLLAGMALYALHFVLSGLRRSLINIALTAWVILHVQYLSITSFSNYILDQHLAAIVLTWAILKLCSEKKPFTIGTPCVRQQRKGPPSGLMESDP